MKGIRCKKCKQKITLEDARGMKIERGGAFNCQCGNVSLDWMPMERNGHGARAEELFRIIGNKGDYVEF